MHSPLPNNVFRFWENQEVKGEDEDVVIKRDIGIETTPLETKYRESWKEARKAKTQKKEEKGEAYLLLYILMIMKKLDSRTWKYFTVHKGNTQVSAKCSGCKELCRESLRDHKCVVRHEGVLPFATIWAAYLYHFWGKIWILSFNISDAVISVYWVYCQFTILFPLAVYIHIPTSSFPLNWVTICPFSFSGEVTGAALSTRSHMK